MRRIPSNSNPAPKKGYKGYKGYKGVQFNGASPSVRVRHESTPVIPLHDPGRIYISQEGGYLHIVCGIYTPQIKDGQGTIYRLSELSPTLTEEEVWAMIPEVKEKLWPT